MNRFPLSSVWVVIAVGVVLWLISGAAARRRDREGGLPAPVCRFLGLLGLAAICLGLYAGFRGPLTLGPVTLGRFSFPGGFHKLQGEALAYAQAHLLVSSTPAPTWHGGSNRALEYSVRNDGTRSVRSLVLSFNMTPGSGKQSIDVTLSGPFPPGRTTKAIATVPSTVSRSYFQSKARVDFGHVVGARF